MICERRPRFRRAEQFPAIKLTARDTEILRTVNRHRFLRAHQIADLVGGSRQQVLRRLQALYHHGYLERPLCQLDYYQNGGSKSIVHGLSARGAALLRGPESIPFARLNWTSRSRPVKRLFLEHALMVSDIMIALELACRRNGGIRLLIEHDIPLPEETKSLRAPFQWTVIHSRTENIGLIPDRVFALEVTDNRKRILCFLEADRGTMPIHRADRSASSVAGKIRAYLATWKAGIHRSRFAISRVRVLAVTRSDSRREHILNETTAIAGKNGIFLIATQEQAARDGSSLLAALV